jgi:hypothetical protein
MKNWKRHEICMESIADVADPTKIFTSAFNAFNLLQLSTSCVEGQRDGWSFDNRSLLQTAQRHLGPVPERTAERRFLSAGKLGYDGITTSKNYVT